jgi:hypothetical protein
VAMSCPSATKIAAAAGVAASAVLFAACGGPDGPASFLFHSDQAAIFVQWTRTGDDVSGSLSAAQVTQAQADPQPTYFSTAPPPGQIVQQTGAFTGTVRGDSVRLLIGSGASSNRVNGRLDGDTLELTIPDGQGAVPTRLTQANHDDYTKAVEQIREHERQRKAAAKTARIRKQAADKAALARVATAFQKALNPKSPDDPCRYVTSDVKERVRPFGDKPLSGRCATDIRNADAETDKPVSNAPLGVAGIRFGVLPPLTVSLNGGPTGAVVTWRPKPAADSFERGRTTMFIEHDGRWLVYRCCP